MGRLIDADKAISDYAHYGISHSYDACDLEDILTECPTVEAIPKADYENRLKDDLKAILVELQSQMANQENPYGFSGSGHGGWQLRNRECQDLIQEKINALKGEQKNE